MIFMFICICSVITEKKLKKVIKEYNCKTIEDVQKYINIGKQCGHCLPEVQRILNEINKE